MVRVACLEDYLEGNNMQKVLIALDYDPTAQKVAEKGYSLAKSLNVPDSVLARHFVMEAVAFHSQQMQEEAIES